MVDPSTCGTGLANQIRRSWALPPNISPTLHIAQTILLSPFSLLRRTKAALLVSWKLSGCIAVRQMQVEDQFYCCHC